MKNIFFFSLVLLMACHSKNPYGYYEQHFIVKQASGSFDSIQKLMDYQGNSHFYKDSFYSVSRLDEGEWGGAVIFKDSATHERYALYQCTIFGFGKSDSGYLLFSHTPHGVWSSVMEVFNPKGIYFLCPTCWRPDPNEWYKLSDSIVKSGKGARQITDMTDSVYDYVGVFSSKKQLYLVMSSKWFNKVPGYTVLAKLDLEKGKAEVIDTLLHDKIYTDQERPWPDHAPVYDPFAEKVYIPVRSRTYRGFIKVEADSITLVKDTKPLSF